MDIEKTTIVIVSLAEADAAEMRKSAEQAFLNKADAVEFRLDHLSDTSDESLVKLFDDFRGPCIITCRSIEEGGLFTGPIPERLELLSRASAMCKCRCWIDFEQSWLDKGFEIPPLAKGQRIILSAHDFEKKPADLRETFKKMAANPRCDVAKAAFMGHSVCDVFDTFEIMVSCPKPAVAISMGELGMPSRLLAKRFGAFGTFSALDVGGGSAPGQAPLEDMEKTYRWDCVEGNSDLFGVIGDPVGHSLSPDVHNAAFDATGYNGVYIPWLVPGDAASFNAFIGGILARPWMQFKGLSVTIPHKENAINYVGAENVDELSRRIGVINTIAFTEVDDKPVVGTNTDYQAILDSLQEVLCCEMADLKGLDAAVLGAGGVSRAAVAALAYAGVNVTIYNRTAEKAVALAKDFDGLADSSVQAKPLSELTALDKKITVNCTSVGMHPKVDASPVAENIEISPETVVFDTIYTPLETKLLKRAAKTGCKTINGMTMFISQAASQLNFWLGMDAPRDVMLKAALEKLSSRK